MGMNSSIKDGHCSNSGLPSQRFIFWVQAPVALAVGPLLFLAIPRSGDLSSLKLRELLHRLSRVDYAGASALVGGVIRVFLSPSY